MLPYGNLRSPFEEKTHSDFNDRFGLMQGIKSYIRALEYLFEKLDEESRGAFQDNLETAKTVLGEEYEKLKVKANKGLAEYKKQK